LAQGDRLAASVLKRSIMLAGHKTSVSLEDAFWKSLRQIAAAKKMTLSGLVAFIDNDRQQRNLSSHIRLFVLEYYQAEEATPSATIAQQLHATPGS
jgi:predicted DNA-binding ribbon-helix-helix protein